MTLTHLKQTIAAWLGVLPPTDTAAQLALLRAEQRQRNAEMARVQVEQQKRMLEHQLQQLQNNAPSSLQQGLAQQQPFASFTAQQALGRPSGLHAWGVGGGMASTVKASSASSSHIMTEQLVKPNAPKKQVSSLKVYLKSRLTDAA